jgi:protein-disulfide isomerase
MVFRAKCPFPMLSQRTIRLGSSVLLLGTALFAMTNAEPSRAAGPVLSSATSKEETKGPIRVSEALKSSNVLAVSLEGLTDTEKKIFSQIVNEEVCPCACPTSWAACLSRGTKCQPAVVYAEYLIEQLASGVSGEVMAEIMAKEISGYAARPLKPNLKGFHQKGSKNPKYEIVEYADFECMHCQAASAVVDELVEKAREPLRVTYKHFPLSFHPMAETAAHAAEAAGNQGKFWEMHHAIFATQNMLDDSLLKGHARALGLNMKRWEKDRKSKEIIEKIKKSREEGDGFKLESTPTFLINGRPYYLDRSVKSFELRFMLEKMRANSSCQ